MRKSRIILGDAREHHPSIEDGSVRCCVTSPPYWGLRDYGVEGQIGLEPTPEAWVAEMVNVFRHVRRYLADDGTLWVNIGDAYAAARGGTIPPAETLAGGVKGRGDEDSMRGRPAQKALNRDAKRFGLKHKDLIGLPWMLAFALRADGWYLRSDIIWHKPNPMPESVTDRPTKSHEYIFLFSKSPRYYFDADAIAEPCGTNMHPRVAGWVDGPGTHSAIEHNRPGVNPKAAAVTLSPSRKHHSKQNASFSAAIAGTVEVRNTRTIWTIPTQPYKGAHYATFPRELAARCIKAGSAAGDLVLDPFLGTGTTIAEALLLGRRGVGIELNPDSVKLAHERIGDLCPLLADSEAPQ